MGSSVYHNSGGGFIPPEERENAAQLYDNNNQMKSMNPIQSMLDQKERLIAGGNIASYAPGQIGGKELPGSIDPKVAPFSQYFA